MADLANQNLTNLIIIFSTVMALLLFWIFYLQYSLFKINKLFKNIFGSSKKKNLAEVISLQNDKIKEISGDIKDFEKNLDILTTRSQLFIQKVGFLRFNPFRDVGGDQSFALCFLDNKNDGVILLSLYNREGVRVYAKPIKGGKSQYSLSDEESKVLERAISGKSIQ